MINLFSSHRTTTKPLSADRIKKGVSFLSINKTEFFVHVLCGSSSLFNSRRTVASPQPRSRQVKATKQHFSNFPVWIHCALFFCPAVLTFFWLTDVGCNFVISYDGFREEDNEKKICSGMKIRPPKRARLQINKTREKKSYACITVKKNLSLFCVATHHKNPSGGKYLFYVESIQLLSSFSFAGKKSLL